jgi:hypothetical protein
VLDQLLSGQEEDEKETWLQAFQEMIGSLVVLESPLSAVSLARLLQVPQEEIQCQLDSLYSVLSVPDSNDAPVHLLHLYSTLRGLQREAFHLQERCLGGLP